MYIGRCACVCVCVCVARPAHISSVNHKPLFEGRGGWVAIVIFLGCTNAKAMQSVTPGVHGVDPF